MPLPPPPGPVPTRIVREIADAVYGLDSVGEVLGRTVPGQAQAGQDADWSQIVKQTIAGTEVAPGKIAVEITAGPFVQQVPTTAGAAKYNSIEPMERDVILTAYLPNPLPWVDAGDHSLGRQTPEQCALAFAAEIWAIASVTAPGEGQTQCGCWLEFAGEEPDTVVNPPLLASFTDVVGGGAVVLGEHGPETAVGLTVYFRVRRGDLTVVA